MNRTCFGYLVSISIVLVCGACSTVYEGKYARDDGWRRGTILEVAAHDSLTQTGFRDCRKSQSTGQSADQFATVQFFGNHRLSTITVPESGGANFKSGDHVYVNIADCAAVLEPRLTE
jgi:hypothetical protein